MKVFKDGNLVDDEAITPEQAREQFNLINQPSKNYSDAQNSQIKSVDEDISEGKRILINLVNDQRQQRDEIDKLNQSMTYLADKMTQMAQVIDQQTKILQGQTPTAPTTTPAQGMDIEKLATTLEHLDPLLNRIFPTQNEAPAIIDNSVIQEKMKQTFFDNLETGESINNFIKNSLKKSVTKNVINTSLKDIGKASIEHGPQ